MSKREDLQMECLQRFIDLGMDSGPSLTALMLENYERDKQVMEACCDRCLRVVEQELQVLYPGLKLKSVARREKERT